MSNTTTKIITAYTSDAGPRRPILRARIDRIEADGTIVVGDRAIRRHPIDAGRWIMSSERGRCGSVVLMDHTNVQITISNAA